MFSGRERVRMRTVFVTASHVLSVRSCWENVCGSMVLGVSSTLSIRMDRVPHLAVFTEIRGTRIQMNRVHCACHHSIKEVCAVFTEIRGTKIHYACHHSIKEVCAVFTRRITSRKNVKPLFLSWYYKDGSCSKAGLYYLF